MQSLISKKFSEEYHFEQLSSSHFPLAKKFYKSARYPSKIGREDEVYVIRHKSIIIAALKLVKLGPYLILRSMVVCPTYRRSGIGNFMLRHLEKTLENRECWCFPFDGLKHFYSAIGFTTCQAEDAPNEIRLKFQQYYSQGKKIFIMKRD